jgi:hypothetical protein
VLTDTLNRIARRFAPPPPPPGAVVREPDVTDAEWATWEAVRPFTMTSFARVLANIRATEYVVRSRIPGAFVECGVWRGGSTMAMARTLAQLGDARDLWLFDTFAGMTPATDKDRTYTGESAESLLETESRDGHVWAIASLEDVQRNVGTLRYPSDRVRYVQGPVESTIPGQTPRDIALLRLDTDWYESTLHELRHLYPRLAPGGILIIDDYGHWSGAKQAVDEYFAGTSTFLHRIDYTGRLVVKPLVAGS